MIKKLNAYYLKQLFNPGIISIFINPFYFIRRRLYIAIRKEANNLQGRILDFGCGLKPYEALFTSATEYIGIDIENPGHDHSKEKVDVYYDGNKIPFGAKSFHCIFFSEVLEHIFNPDDILKEMHRVLAAGGVLFITTPFVWDEHEIPNDFGRYSSFGIKHLLEKNGFTVIKQEKTGHFVEVVSQLIILYLRYILYTRNRYLNLFINLIFIAPFTIIGIVFSTILPRRKSLFFSNIVIAQKNAAGENSANN
jgi:SAM-dependent methyltransferase